VKAVNGRYLEPSIRVPKEWADKENAVREIVRERVGRGSVTMYIRSETVEAVEAVHVNMELARTYVSALRTVQQELGLVGDVSIEHLLSYPAIFQGTADDSDRPDIWPELQAGVLAALANMNDMREKEGAQLAIDFEQRLTTVETLLTQIETGAPLRIETERQRLRDRIRQVLEDMDPNDPRLQSEIILLSDKLDIAEECVRLRSHLQYFRETMRANEPVGRKLNFLMQEMNREVNTIGSKSSDAEVARQVVTMKEELERIREQVQNVE
jgi:uncharacterized protein (TIGR00255 family)